MRAQIGNIYINNKIIGTVVGIQTLGGEGLYDTDPKTGCLHFLYRLCSEQTVMVNNAAAGENAALLAGH